MKDRVDASHRVGESECERDSTWMSYDLEWSQKLISEFLGWTGSANKLRSHENLIANCEVGWRIPMSVHSSLVSLLSLGHGQLQFLVKGLQVDRIVVCSCRSEVTLWVHFQGWVIPLVCIKWGHAGCF